MSLLSRSAERRSEYRTDAGIAPVRGKRFSLPAQSLSHNHRGGVGHPLWAAGQRGVKDLHHKKSHQLIHVLPTSLILLVSFPAGMLPETFASRERIGASASQGGTCAAGEVWPGGGPIGQKLENAGAGGPWIASIAYHIPQDPRPGTARLSHLSTARRNCGRGNGKTISPHSRTALALLRHAP